MIATLYKQDVTGKIRCWAIDVEGNSILIHHGLLGGSIQTKRETITKGLAGRTMAEQINSRVRSRINLQKDRGYIDDLEVATQTKPTNTLGFQQPMLAQRYDRQRKLHDDYFLQYKYDGNRCLITKENGEMYAYTRQGKLNPNLGHILDACDHVPEGTILDGELYSHGVSLQTIRSWVARKQPDTERLKFVCYDQVAFRGYAERLQELVSFELEGPIELAETVRLRGSEASQEALAQHLTRSLRQGYEGLILRDPWTRYETGKRSKSLLKLKPGMLASVPMDEEEFPIVDVLESKDGWAILVCLMPNSETFKVSAPGDMAAKREAWLNREQLLGVNVTVEFAGRTMYGTPFHPVALAYRNSE